MSYDFLTDLGMIVPDMSQTHAEVEAEFRAIPGWASIATDPETPIGALLTAEALRRDAIARTQADMANQINPNVARGAWLDALCALTGMQRKAGTGSVGWVWQTVDPLNPVPQGTRYMDSATGLVWVTTTAFGMLGTIQVILITCADDGPNIISPTGIDTMLDPVAGTAANDIIISSLSSLGTPAETDARLRERREASRSSGLTYALGGMVAALRALPFLRTAYIIENNKSTQESIGQTVYDGMLVDFMIEPRSILPVIEFIHMLDESSPEVQEKLADTIFAHKPTGVDIGNYSYDDFTNRTDYIVTEPGVVSLPIPWGYAKIKGLAVKVDITCRGAGLTSDAVKNFVKRAFAGEAECWAGPEPGEMVSEFELAAAINELYPSIYITALVIDSSGGGPLVGSKWRRFTIAENDITVTLQ